MAHAGSAPIMAYLLPQKLDRKLLVGTQDDCGSSSFASNYAKIIPYAFLGQLDLTNLLTALVLLPLVPIGVRLGVIIQGKLDEKVFYQISYWALLGIGMKLVYDGMTGFLRWGPLRLSGEPPRRRGGECRMQGGEPRKRRGCGRTKLLLGSMLAPGVLSPTHGRPVISGNEATPCRCRPPEHHGRCRHAIQLAIWHKWGLPALLVSSA